MSVVKNRMKVAKFFYNFCHVPNATNNKTFFRYFKLRKELRVKRFKDKK